MIVKFDRFSKRSEIDSICEKYGIKNYTINDDLTIDVDGNVDLFNNELKKLPLKFRNVSGDFYCRNNQLTTLEGSPQKVEGDFYCQYNQLTTLSGSPQKVWGIFYCYNNQLTTLEGSPKTVGSYFYCDNNQLKDVKGFPERFYGVKIYISNNPIEEIFKLFPEEKWVELPESLNEHDPIRGDIIILQRLEQCFYDLGLEIPENIKFRKYKVREF